MASPIRAVDYVFQPERFPPRPVCVAFGDEPFLRRRALLTLREAVLGKEGGDFSLSTFEGQAAEYRDVLQELSTVAMFGPGKRLVVVEAADEFVRRHREPLEQYVQRPAPGGVLALELRSFPANTRLYKAVAAGGLAVACNCPRGAELVRWLLTWAKRVHGVRLAEDAAGVLVEMVGPQLGLLDQEVAKLALSPGSQEKISPQMVARSVGSWRAKTTWEMLDAALSGEVEEAMTQLDRLLASGESPIGLLAQISAPLRRLAAAARLVLQSAAGQRISLRSALQRAGVRSFALEKAERQLRHLGHRRAGRLDQWLLQADLDLKGASALPPRLILERLIVRLAAPRELAADRGA